MKYFLSSVRQAGGDGGRRFQQFLLICGLLSTLLALGCSLHTQVPFQLSVVPTTSRDTGVITLAPHDSRDFYVVLRNIGDKPQAIWDDWNSWGYQAVSFEITTPDGHTSHITKREQGFGKNGPSRFVIQPGESKVFCVRFDEDWNVQPTIQKADNTPVTLRAIYEVRPTPESNNNGVWVGRVESKEYHLDLQQW